jgi:hypothetical protein
MGWEYDFETAIEDECGVLIASGTVAKVARKLSAEHRIALARELLAGTEWVVAREVGGARMEGVFDYDHGRMDGWNACRAAIMREGE